MTMQVFLESGTFPPPQEMMANGVPQLKEWNPEMFDPLADKMFGVVQVCGGCILHLQAE